MIRFLSTRVAPVKLTFFTKPNCGLCEEAKNVLNQVLQKAPSENVSLTYVDITHPQNKEWHDSYRYDIPVLHIDRQQQLKPIKFMHRLDPTELYEELSQEL